MPVVRNQPHLTCHAHPFLTLTFAAEYNLSESRDTSICHIEKPLSSCPHPRTAQYPIRRHAFHRALGRNSGSWVGLYRVLNQRLHHCSTIAAISYVDPPKCCPLGQHTAPPAKASAQSRFTLRLPHGLHGIFGPATSGQLLGITGVREEGQDSMACRLLPIIIMYCKQSENRFRR